MFGWFRPQCPLETWEKTWTETRMLWLAQRLGIEPLLQAEVILPNEQYFPDPYHGGVEDAQRMLNRLCGYMRVDPHTIELEVCADYQLPGAAGHYVGSDKAIIRIAESQLQEPLKLAATLAHELAHEILLGGGLLSPEVADHEWVTDLLPVFLGVGVFAANAVITERSGLDGQISWWVMQRQGYLPARIFGYAFALFAFVRDEPKPSWATHLRPDAASALRGGLDYLTRTNDTLFHPDTAHQKPAPRSVDELSERLQSPSPTVRLSTLWDIADRGVAAADAAPAVIRCLDDQEPCIPGEAARALSNLGPAAAPALPQLLKALRSPVASTRAGSAEALGVLLTQPQEVIPELGVLLEDEDRTVVTAAAAALRRFGHEAETEVRRLLPVFTSALLDCDDSLIEELVATLDAITAEPRRAVRKHLGTHDPELCQAALETLKEFCKRNRRSNENT